MGADFTDMQDTNPFWEFSLEFYAYPGVAAACLLLQDEFNIDVNVLLFCLWRAREGERLEPDSLAALDAELASWRRDVVWEIRRLRQCLRAYPGIDSTRQLLKQAELEAERVQQERMWNWQEVRGDHSPCEPGAAIAQNIALYAGLLNIEPSGLSAVESLALEGLSGRL